MTLAKGESDNAREQVARVLLAMVEKVENRGTVIQQGGAKALLPLARDNTKKGWNPSFRVDVLMAHAQGL